MTPVKYGLFYVGLAMATAVGDGLLRSTGRRSSLATWPAAVSLVYGALVLLLHPRTVWWPAGLAAAVLTVPLAAALSVLRDAWPRSAAAAQEDPRVALREDLERRVHDLAAQLHAGRVTVEEWRAGVRGLAEEAAAG